MFVIHRTEHYHTLFAKPGTDNESERASERASAAAAKNVATRDFPHGFVVCFSCTLPKSHPRFTTQGETSLKLAPIYGLCRCQTQIPFLVKKAH